jgi:predicted Zn-dependent protease
VKFSPRTPREGINVSDDHPLKEAATLIFGVAAIVALIGVAMIFLVDLVILAVPADTEARVFKSWLPDDAGQDESGGAMLQKAQALLERLATHNPESPYTFRLALNDSDQANAMALPGGLIVVTRGLLDQLESENELAFVLGHEMGHFRHRDHLRALGRGLSISLLLTVVAGTEAGSFGIRIAGLTLRQFSREQETDADEFALGIVYAEYGHVNQSWRFFERLDSEPQRGTGSLIAYFSTHPVTQNRIENIKTLARRNNWPVTGTVRKWQP